MQLLTEYAFPEAIRRVSGVGPEVCSTSTIATKLDRTLSGRPTAPRDTFFRSMGEAVWNLWTGS